MYASWVFPGQTVKTIAFAQTVHTWAADLEPSIFAEDGTFNCTLLWSWSRKNSTNLSFDFPETKNFAKAKQTPV